MDADIEQLQRVPSTGADRVEFYTGPFADAWNESEQAGKDSFAHYAHCAEFAHSLGLGINAGHDLNLENMRLFKSLPELSEVSIGHALTIESLEQGLATTLQRYRALLADA